MLGASILLTLIQGCATESSCSVAIQQVEGASRLYVGVCAPIAVGKFDNGVHCFKWSGASSVNTSVTWTANWRYLTACNNGCDDPETDGIWASGTRTGLLSTPNSSADGATGFKAGGVSWSDAWDITVPTPQTSWVVPPSNTIRLP
ncbi:hypothetical protein ACWA7J_21035 [Leptothrix sp. BB-4]